MRRVLFICASILLIGGIVIGYIFITNESVTSFRLSDQQKYIDACASNKSLTLEPITDRKNLEKQAELLWIDLYGKEETDFEKPFAVFYDAENDAWYIKGTLPSGYMGGVANMIVLSSGEVLASWHTK